MSMLVTYEPLARAVLAYLDPERAVTDEDLEALAAVGQFRMSPRLQRPMYLRGDEAFMFDKDGDLMAAFYEGRWQYTCTLRPGRGPRNVAVAYLGPDDSPDWN